MVSLRRTRRPRPVSWSALEIHHSVETMSIASSSASSRPRTRDTGFPESFCGSKYRRLLSYYVWLGFCILTQSLDRNTTLPHPDADTSPNACISQDDISISRVLSRQRRSFLAKHKRITSHGIITPDMQMYSDNTASAMTSDSEPSPGLASARLPTIPGTPAVGHMARPPSKDGGDSFASTSTGDHNDVAPKPPADRHHFRLRLSSDGDSTAEVKAGRRRSFMERLGIHRHHD